MMLHPRRTLIASALAASVLCALSVATLRAQITTKKAGAPAMMAMNAPTKAVATLHATKSGGEASGKVTFTKVEGGIRVEAEIHGLTPGEHGFHIHEFGDVSSPDAMSTGGHFNPGMSEPHAAPTATMRHVGDMGNITANANGNAKVDYVDTHMSFSGMNSIIGRGVIVHEKADDLKTQPTGNAGARVAAGKVGIAKP
jgi:superoxide dismutase, Cu-Zn family